MLRRIVLIIHFYTHYVLDKHAKSYVLNRMENPKQEHMQIKKLKQRSSTAAFREQETPMRSLTIYIVTLIASLERGRVSS